MKLPYSFLIVFLAQTVTLSAQCFSTNYTLGMEALSRANYDLAIEKWLTAYDCPDKPQLHQLDSLITQADIQRTQSIMRAGQNAVLALRLAKTDPTLALRVAEKNRAFHPDDPVAKYAFSEILSNPDHTFYSHFHSSTANFKAIATAPDGAGLVAATQDGRVFWFDGNGRAVDAVNLYPGEGEALAFTMAFSPDRNLLAIAGMKKLNEVTIWDLTEGIISEIAVPTALVNSVTFTPDSQQLLIGFRGGANLYDLQGELVQGFSGDFGNAFDAAFSADGQRLLIGGGYSVAVLYDLYGSEIQRFEGHEAAVRSVAFAPDADLVLTGSFDRTARLWDLSGRELLKLEGHSVALEKVAFVPGQALMVTGDQEGTIRVWNANGEVSHTCLGMDRVTVHDLCMAGGGATLVSATGPYLQWWALEGKAVDFFIDSTDQTFSSAAIDLAEEHLVTGSTQGICSYWTLDGRLIKQFDTGMNANITDVVLSPTENIFLTLAWEEPMVRLWDTDGKMLGEYRSEGSTLQSVAFTPDGDRIATGDEHGRVKIWNLEGKLMKTALPFANIELGPDETVPIDGMTYSPDNKHLLVVNEVYGPKLWDLVHNTWLPVGDGSSNTPYGDRVAFSPDGSHFLVSLGSSGKFALYGLNGQQLYTFNGHQGFIDDLRFSRDGKYIVSASDDNKVILWDAYGHQILVLSIHLHDATFAYITKDLERVLSTNRKGAFMQSYMPAVFLRKRVAFFPEEKLLEAGFQKE